jgi:hypothetical protein
MGFGIDLRDEYLHVPGDDPMWRESFWLDAYDSQSGVGLIIYTHARPSARAGDALVFVAGPGGVATHDVHGGPYDVVHTGPAVEVGGVRFRVSEPGRELRVGVSSREISGELCFQGVGPIYDYDWEAWTWSRHYEQLGRVRGAISAGGNEVRSFEGTGTRDHAWGRRGGVPWRRWGWMNARFPGDQAWHLCVIEGDADHLFGYTTLGGNQEALTGRLQLQLDDAGKVESGEAELRTASHRHRGHLRVLAAIDRAKTDPTKRGVYDYYIVEVVDPDLGHGYGVLDYLVVPEASGSAASELSANADPS